MDVNTILDESLKTFSRPAASKAAQFILMLSVIDRTVLPRRITFANGRGTLVLAVAERRVQVESGAELSAAALVARMAGFCMEAHALRHEVRAPGSAEMPAGFTIGELVNAQQGAASGGAEPGVISVARPGFTFDDRGWPVKIPEHASAKSVVSAWLVHLWMQSWLKRREALLGGSVLMTTTTGTRSRELAFRFSSRATELATLGSGELGRLLAAWRVAENAAAGTNEEAKVT
jgi:hypothetical protein